MHKKLKITKPGEVNKILKPPVPDEPEKVEIEVQDADHLYKDIRMENTLEDQDGHKRKFKQGAHVSVTIEADIDQTVPKNDEKQQ